MRRAAKDELQRVLYTFRCAVYAARTEKPKAELLKWWNWKGRTLAPTS
jgi:hypothetical protein